MENNETPPDPINEEDQRRRTRLLKHTQSQPRANAQNYSLFVRRMRLFLPLLAVVIIVTLISWPQNSETIVATEEEQKEQYKNVQKNELLNPRFESVDEKNQPYTITADKALQDDNDKNLLILTNPLGKMTLNSNHTVTIGAQEGFYQQEQEKLHLKDSVRLTQDEGYEMTMAELFIDMQGSTAHSETPVTGKGPQGTLSAQGLQADHANNHIIFTGPAKLELQDVSFMQGLSGAGKKEGAL